MVQSTPLAQYSINEQVWLEAKHLALPYQTVKLTSKWHSPFRIIKQVSLVTYKLELLPAWTIHPVFHASFLTLYHKTAEHGANYQWPPLEMIDDQEEYEVEQVISHWYYGHMKALQYLMMKLQLKRVFKQRRELCRRWGILLSPKVYLYTLWSTCVHKPLRGD